MMRASPGASAPAGARGLGCRAATDSSSSSTTTCRRSARSRRGNAPRSCERDTHRRRARDGRGLYRGSSSPRERREDQRRLAQLGEAARTLAHEIKNPLTAAQMQTALLRRSTRRRASSDRRDRRGARADPGLTDQMREFLKSGSAIPKRSASSRSSKPRRSARDPVALSGDDSTRRSASTANAFSRSSGIVLRNAREATMTGRADAGGRFTRREGVFAFTSRIEDPESRRTNVRASSTRSSRRRLTAPASVSRSRAASWRMRAGRSLSRREGGGTVVRF